MKAVLLRHATRSATGLGDSSLNALGSNQAEALAQRCLAPHGPLPHPTHLLVSPKLRARETLQPLSETTRLHLKIDERLDERHQNETSAEFMARVRQFLAEVEQTPEKDSCVFICSHLDWLEAALITISSDMNEIESAASWMTAEFRIFKIEDGLWSLKNRGRAEG